MAIAYAATEGGGHHGEEHSIGETILHHVQDTHVFDLWPLGHVNLPEIHLFGIDFSITKASRHDVDCVGPVDCHPPARVPPPGCGAERDCQHVGGPCCLPAG